MAGPPFLEESGDGDVTGPVVYVNTASKADLDEIDADHVSLKGAIALVRLGAPGGGGFQRRSELDRVQRTAQTRCRRHSRVF